MNIYKCLVIFLTIKDGEKTFLGKYKSTFNLETQLKTFPWVRRIVLQSKQTDKQTEISLNLFTSLGTQRCPGYSWVTHAVYPYVVDFTGKLNFCYKSRPTQLIISKPSNDRTYKHTDKQRYYLITLFLSIEIER